MTHYLSAADGKLWRWAEEPYPGCLDPVAELPPGEKITGRLIDHGTCLEIRLDSKPKMPKIE